MTTTRERLTPEEIQDWCLRLRPLLHSRLRRLATWRFRPHLREDLRQEAYVRLIQLLQTYRPGIGTVQGYTWRWLGGYLEQAWRAVEHGLVHDRWIARPDGSRRTVHSLSARHQTDDGVSSPYADDLPDRGPGQEPGRDELTRVWDRAREILTPEQYAAVDLRYRQGLRGDHLARTLGVTHEAARVRLVRALARLRAQAPELAELL